MSKYLSHLAVSAIVLLTSVFGLAAFTTAKVNAAIASGCDGSTFLGIPTWYKYLDVGPKIVVSKDDDGNATSTNVGDPCAIIGPKDTTSGEFSLPAAIPRIVLAVVEMLLRISGIVTIGFVIYGGFRYMTSQGEAEGLKQAQGTIVNALIGLAISVLAVTIVSFVGNALW
jgi:hypothetical protein